MNSKDYYTILGISSDATAEQIKMAYLLRSKMFHPDRFSPTTQRREWELANEMLKDLNQAYSTLRDSLARSAYDRDKENRAQKNSSPPQPPPRSRPSPKPPPYRPPPDFGPLSSGSSGYHTLEKTARNNITARIKGLKSQQFSIPLQGVLRHYFYLLLFPGWLWFLFATSDNSLWDDDSFHWMLGITVVVSLMTGGNLSWIVRWHSTPWKSRLLVTPLYFVKTRLNHVWYWPVWKLKSVNGTHNYRNGVFTGTKVELVFDTGVENFTFSDRTAYDKMVDAARVFRTRASVAQERGEYDYFVAENDFKDHTLPTTTKPRRPSFTTLTFCTIVTIAGSVLAFIAREANISHHPYHPPTHYNSYQPVTPSLPPLQTAVSAPKFSEPQLPDPPSGTIRRYTNEGGVAPLKILSSTGTNYLVKLDDFKTGHPVVSIFIRGGQTEEIDVPTGSYVVKYATGTKWYGYKYLFGPYTSYSKVGDEFKFYFDGGSYEGYSLTLYQVSNGNLNTSTINPDDF